MIYRQHIVSILLVPGRVAFPCIVAPRTLSGLERSARLFFDFVGIPLALSAVNRKGLYTVQKTARCKTSKTYSQSFSNCTVLEGRGVIIPGRRYSTVRSHVNYVLSNCFSRCMTLGLMLKNSQSIFVKLEIVFGCSRFSSTAQFLAGNIRICRIPTRAGLCFFVY